MDRPPFIKPRESFEGTIDGKIENCSWSKQSGRLMGVMVGSNNRQFRDGQFIVTAPITECLGTDLYRVQDGSVYIVEWVEDIVPMNRTDLPDVVEDTVHPGKHLEETVWHFVYRGAKATYEEDCWKFYHNGPTEYWKRIDNGYITPRQAAVEGWRYGGPAVW